METQQITDSAQPSNPRAWLRRLVGASKPYGAEYEFKLAGLLALRARRRKLRFQVFTNVSAARPCDDIVFRVLGEEPATVFVQLKHANEDTPTKATKIAGQAFTSPKGDFSLKKYFAFYAAFSQKQSAAPDSLRKDERLLCACAMRDVRFVLFTNRSVVRAAGAADAPHLPFCHEEVFNTAPAAATGPVKVFSFGDADADVWNIYKNQPENQVYQEEFLPRLRVFSEQVHTNDLDCLIKMELDMVFGAPLPRTDQFLSGYVAFLRSWALDDDQGYALSNSSGELEELLAKDFEKQGRQSAGNGALLFREEHCTALRELLSNETTTRVSVLVRGVPSGLRAAKVLQLLDEMADRQDAHPSAAAGRPGWAYVGDQALRDFPLPALEAACGACRVLVLDADTEQHEWATGLGSRLKVVVVASGEDAGALEEDWRLDHLTPDAQDRMLDATVIFQGDATPLRQLLSAWPSLRADVDGPLLSSLVRGERPALGLPPPSTAPAPAHLPRALLHPATVRPAALAALDPRRDLLALAGFPKELLDKMVARLGAQKENAALGEMELGLQEKASGKPKRWTILPYDENIPKNDEVAFREVCEKNKGRNVHWLQYCGPEEVEELEVTDVVMAWRRTEGSASALAPFARLASDACARAPTCEHGQAVHAAAAWNSKVGLLVGEPGMGKSHFLRRLAAEARERAPGRWVVLVQALAHCHLLEKWPPPEELELERALELLAAAAGVAGSSAASRRCLEAAFHSGAVDVLVDGVDEVCPAYKDKLLRFLRLLLLDTPARRLWVTSRPEVEASLRQTLRCPASTLRPFSKAEQKHVLCVHWASKSDMHASEFDHLADEMVETLHAAAAAATGGGGRSLLDVPLHANMAAEVFEDDAAAALRARGGLLPNSGLSLYELYRRFVEKKRELFKKRYGLDDPKLKSVAIVDNFYGVHQNCAMIVLVSDGAFGDVSPEPFEDYVQCNLEYISKEKTGILWMNEDEIPQFAHYTFAEFFAARWAWAQTKGRSRAAGVVWRALVSGKTGRGVRQILEHMLAEGIPLHQAVLDGDERALSEILASGDPDDVGPDAFGRRALHVAAALGREDFLDALLRRGCDFRRKDARLQWTPLRYACAARQMQAAERLLLAGADACDVEVDDVGEAALEAAKLGLVHVMRHLIAPDITQNTSSRPKNAISATDVEGNSPLHVATLHDQRDIVKLLLEHGADNHARTKRGLTPLMVASKRGKYQCALLLLQHGADVSAYSSQGITPLHRASLRGDTEIMKLLVEYGAEVDVRTNEGLTPIVWATATGRTDSVLFLLQNGADATACLEGASTLHVAALFGFHEIAALLVEYGAALNARSNDGETPILLAVKEGKLECVECLLRLGADISMSDNNENTCLHHAAFSGYYQIVQLLVQNGADVNAQNKIRLTPLMMAQQNAQAECVSFLVQNGADIASDDEESVTSQLSHAQLKSSVAKGRVSFLKHLADHSDN